MLSLIDEWIILLKTVQPVSGNEGPGKLQTDLLWVSTSMTEKACHLSGPVAPHLQNGALKIVKAFFYGLNERQYANHRT